LVDELFEKYKLPVVIWDLRWFSANFNHNANTIQAYDIFVNTYLHEYNKPGKSHIIANLDDDSRLFVFLQQQFDTVSSDRSIDNLLADTLILFALEDTDPDLKIVKKPKDIYDSIKKYLKFDVKLLNDKISERLTSLSKKPRKIQYHSKLKGYCLPYSTRSNIRDRNIQDNALVDVFNTQSVKLINKYFKDSHVSVKDINALIKTIFNNIYYRQGLEFSNFVLHGDSQSVVEQNLNEIISEAVEKSKVISKNQSTIKTALHLAIREIVYNGSEEQSKFLKALSNTYMLMFLLQWEPKISIYFQSLASKMKIFVDNSIIIPALSEYFLSKPNRRHWNLLEGATKAGISLFINETLLNELISHFKMVVNKYYNDFKAQEDVYLNDESDLIFVEEIMIRAYFYAKKRKFVQTFNQFITNFVDVDFQSTKEDLIEYLKSTFGIEYISNKAGEISIDQSEKDALTDRLKHRKKNDIRAVNDAEMILSIYYLREKNNESSSSGIFGYKTWWLSKDTSTYKAVRETFGDAKYTVSCYIRPDFIYNYIALSPTTDEVRNAYQEMFPTMLGVNLSYHMPREVASAVQDKIKEFHLLPNVRIKQIVKRSIDRLKSDPTIKDRRSVESIFDEELKNDQD
jgi:hypothetical protein